MKNLNFDKFNNNDELILRKIMGHFATGVAIATSNFEGKPYGITINSLTSVSLSPPLLLFCISKQSGTLAAFENTQNFAINILSEQQIDFSRRFAKFNLNKFEGIEIGYSSLNLPIFENSLAVFECQKYATYEGGDHLIFLGEILSAKVENEIAPLLYYAGHYSNIKQNRDGIE